MQDFKMVKQRGEERDGDIQDERLRLAREVDRDQHMWGAFRFLLRKFALPAGVMEASDKY